VGVEREISCGTGSPPSRGTGGSHRLLPYFEVLRPDVLQPAVDLDPEVALKRLWAKRLRIAVPYPVPDTGRQTVEKVGRVWADPGDALRRR
jgi:hypothetical protein